MDMENKLAEELSQGLGSGEKQKNFFLGGTKSFLKAATEHLVE